MLKAWSIGAADPVAANPIGSNKSYHCLQWLQAASTTEDWTACLRLHRCRLPFWCVCVWKLKSWGVRHEDCFYVWLCDPWVEALRLEGEAVKVWVEALCAYCSWRETIRVWCVNSSCGVWLCTVNVTYFHLLLFFFHFFKPTWSVFWIGLSFWSQFDQVGKEPFDRIVNQIRSNPNSIFFLIGSGLILI